jgi:hypothetical protein
MRTMRSWHELYSPDTATAYTRTTMVRLAGPSPAFAWTGSQLFVWGAAPADNGVATDGALYYPSTHRWTTLPAAPIHSYGWARPTPSDPR